MDLIAVIDRMARLTGWTALLHPAHPGSKL